MSTEDPVTQPLTLLHNNNSKDGDVELDVDVGLVSVSAESAAAAVSTIVTPDAIVTQSCTTPTSTSIAMTEVTTTVTPPDPPPLLPLPNKSQDVRVDNWGNYCLNRLHTMFEKGEFTDLVLQFRNHVRTKVHRVVVNMCTDYFVSLEKVFGLTGGCLVIPRDVDPHAMLTIIKFFYTGKLEVRAPELAEVYRTVRVMNITILAKLLEAHARKPATPSKPLTTTSTTTPLPTLSPTRPVLVKGTTDLAVAGRTVTKIQLTNAQAAALLPSALNKKLLPGGRAVVGGMKTKTVLARLQAPGGRQQTHALGNISLVRANSQKRLPIWKDRKYLPASPTKAPDRWALREEPARPTRFEWNEEEEKDESNFMTSTTTSFMQRQNAANAAAKAAVVRRGEEMFDSVKSHISNSPLKRMAQSPEVEVPNAKLSRMEKELARMESSDPEDNGVESGEEDVILEKEKRPPPLKKPPPGIMKTTPAPPAKKPVSKVEKNVRFAAGDLKEGGEDGTSSNHSKIISEVLKKYPQLVKDNKNIKLKIVQKGAGEKESPGSTGGSTSGSGGKSKVSYIVLKSTSSPDSAGSVLLRKPSPSARKTTSTFWDSPNKPVRGPAEENTKGPWLCSNCTVDEVPTEFDSYYTYRRHLVDTHGERIDVRICEHCGYKASKRNLLLFHLFTKHGIDPPRNVHFPTCDRCDYVALTDTLLLKHYPSHDPARELPCNVCGQSFRTNADLERHSLANLHRDRTRKIYECPYCTKPFVTVLSLKGHIRGLHRDLARNEEMEDPGLPKEPPPRPKPKEVEQVELEVEVEESHEQHEEWHGEEGNEVNITSGSTIEIIHAMDPSMPPITLVPSSEAEAMNNVASSIAASLGLDAGGGGSGGEYEGGAGGAVYIMDGGGEAVGLEMTSDGRMILGGDGGDMGAAGFIVQDMQGNQFQRMTGIDENGKEVIFFQLAEDSSHHSFPPTLLDEGGNVIRTEAEPRNQLAQHFDLLHDPNSAQSSFTVQNDHMYLDPNKCSVFVSAGVESGGGGGTTQLVFSTADGSQLMEMLPIQSEPQDGEGQHLVLKTHDVVQEVEMADGEMYGPGIVEVDVQGSEVKEEDEEPPATEERTEEVEVEHMEAELREMESGQE